MHSVVKMKMYSMNRKINTQLLLHGKIVQHSYIFHFICTKIRQVIESIYYTAIVFKVLWNVLPKLPLCFVKGLCLCLLTVCVCSHP